MGRIYKFLNSKEVARILDMTPDSVVTLAREGKLRGAKLRRPWIFQLSDVEA